jgi:hypothetical protein
MKHRLVLVLTLLAACASLAQAQRRSGRTRGGFGGGRSPFSTEELGKARDMESGSTGTPNWTNPAGFERDVFTFARARYGSGYGYGYGRVGGWLTDAPDSDLNLSYRLQQMTSLRVDPDGRFVSLDTGTLANFPWIYIVEPGRMSLTEPESMALRKYLLNGGFLWLDDLWVTPRGAMSSTR